MNLMSYILTIFLLLYTWAVTEPLPLLSFVAKQKRRWRCYLIQRKGEAAAAEFATIFSERSLRQGFESALVEKVLSDFWPEIVERLGIKETNASLDEPTSLERTF